MVFISWLWLILWWKWECRYLFKILISFCLQTYWELGWLDHIIVSFLTFKGTSILGSIKAVPIYILTIRVPFSPYSQNYSFSLVFLILSHSRMYVVISHFGFHLHWSDDQWCWAYTSWPLYVSLRKQVIQWISNI